MSKSKKTWIVDDAIHPMQDVFSLPFELLSFMFYEAGIKDAEQNKNAEESRSLKQNLDSSLGLVAQPEDFRSRAAVAKKFAAEVGYFGDWQKADAFEISWTEHFKELTGELKKCGYQFENDRSIGQKNISKHPKSGRVPTVYVTASLSASNCANSEVSIVLKKKLLLASLLVADVAAEMKTTNEEGAEEVLTLSRDILKISLSLAVDSIPIVGTTRAFAEAIVGQSILPDFEDLSPAERALGIILSAPGLKVLQKVGSKAVKTRAAKDLLARLNKMTFAKKDKSLLGKAIAATDELVESATEILKTTPQLKKAWSENFKVIKIETSEAKNAHLKDLLNYTEPPFKKGTHVMTVKLKAEEQFVRVWNKVEGKEIGPWFMKADDIKGLSGMQIKEKFNLPAAPTHVSTFKIPKGTQFDVGLAGSNAFGNVETTVQFFYSPRLDGIWKVGKEINL